MESVAGIYASRSNAARVVNEIKNLGVPEERLVLLTPDTSSHNVELEVPTEDAESPGIGDAMGGVVGGALGAAGGATLGTAAASLLVPGVGPVLAAGILGAAVLGIGGAVSGAAVGGALEESLDRGLPHDELLVYEDALRSGKSVVLAFVEDDDAADRVKRLFTQSGAETIDAAREDWWLGLRDVEEEHYRAQGKDFSGDEISYRRGFEAALNSRLRGKNYSDARSELERFYKESGADEAFRHGYERGLTYHKNNQTKAKATTASNT